MVVFLTVYFKTQVTFLGLDEIAETLKKLRPASLRYHVFVQY